MDWEISHYFLDQSEVKWNQSWCAYMRFPVVGVRCVKWFWDVIGRTSHISKKFLLAGDKREKTCVT